MGTWRGEGERRSLIHSERSDVLNATVATVATVPEEEEGVEVGGGGRSEEEGGGRRREEEGLFKANAVNEEKEEEEEESLFKARRRRECRSRAIAAGLWRGGCGVCGRAFSVVLYVELNNL